MVYVKHQVMVNSIITPRKLAILPNQEGFEFVAIYKDGTEKIQKVVKIDGIHTTENFSDLVGWKVLNLRIP